MPNLSISQLPPAAEVSGSDLLPLVQRPGAQGQPVKITVEQLLSGRALLTGVPASASAAGLPGEFSYDQEWFYIYTGNGTVHSWMRVGIATW